MNPPVFVALDLDDLDQALQLAQKVSPYVGGYKIGPRLTYKYGALGVEKLTKLGSVFVDNKYFDIPNTMVSAVRTTFDSGASYTTIHAASGLDALKMLAELEKELNQIREFKILCVTVLTSFDFFNLPSHQKKFSIEDQVEMLAKDVVESGLSGIVCSPNEVQRLRQLYPHAYLVTPGIRLLSNATDDQKRVTTPNQAIRMGASALVVGRPIVEAKDPALAAQEIFESLKHSK